MRTFFLAIIALILMALGGPGSAAEHRDIVIDQVHIIPMDEERVLRDRAVRISDGQIIEIRSAGHWQADDGIQLIDGRNGYLMPGLAEMHAHVPGEQAPMQLREDILFLYLSNGVTLARGMLGEPWHLELREGLEEGQFLGPRLITSGPSLNGNSVDSPEAGREMVRDQVEAGYDFLKIHPGLGRAEFDAIAEEANELGMAFAGHVPEDVGIYRALEAGYASIDHLDRYPRALVD
ncbi:amidohydrolase family protein, partial [Gammaproteobacteria bacterium AB-CW1]|nr:amidohydrolase family protein [Gammaproteobacteria bacterium AB-CW1]